MHIPDTHGVLPLVHALIFTSACRCVRLMNMMDCGLFRSWPLPAKGLISKEICWFGRSCRFLQGQILLVCILRGLSRVRIALLRYAPPLLLHIFRLV